MGLARICRVGVVLFVVLCGCQSRSVSTADRTVAKLRPTSSEGPSVFLYYRVLADESVARSLSKQISIQMEYLNSCFADRSLKPTKKDQMKAEVHWSLNRNGYFDELRVTKMSWQDEVFRECLLSGLRLMRFQATSVGGGDIEIEILNQDPQGRVKAEGGQSYKVPLNSGQKQDVKVYQ